MATPFQDIPANEGLQPEAAQQQALNYRAVTGLGVMSLLLGVLSVLSCLHWAWGLIPAAGIITGWIAWRQILRTPEEVTGASFAKWGVILSASIWVVGSIWLTYVSYTQAPPGYKVVSYLELQVPPGSPPGMLVPPRAEELNGERIFICGYMVPGRRQSGITRFFLSDDTGVFPFNSPKPKITQLVDVKLVSDLEAEFTTRLIGVGGVFRVETGKPKKKPDANQPVRTGPNDKAGQPAPEKPSGGALYQLEADYLW